MAARHSPAGRPSSSSRSFILLHARPLPARRLLPRYAVSGTVLRMEVAAGWLKRSGLLISVDAIHVVASAHIAHRKYYRLGKFGRGVGLGRPNAGNLLLHPLLVAFLEMDATGFRQDLQHCNNFERVFSEKNEVHEDTITLLDSRSPGVKNQDARNMSIANMSADTRGPRSLMASESNFRGRILGGA